MKILKAVCTLCLMLLIGTSTNAQLFYFSGQVGYAKPQGNAFKDETTGEKLSSFGIGYDADVMMCFDRFDNKLSAGIMYVGNALFGIESSSSFDIGLYALSLYGVKGQYRFRIPEKKVSPYVSVGLGLSQFATPDVYSGETLIAEGKSAFSFGVRPEIGFDLGGFLLSAAYFAPMHYSIESETGDFSGSAGTFSISLGFRQYLSFNNGLSFSRSSRSNDSDAINTSNSKKAKKNTESNSYTESETTTNNDSATVLSSEASTNQTKTNANKNAAFSSSQEMPQSNADRVSNPTNPSDARVSFFNTSFRVGEKVLYQVRDKVYTATIISFIGNDIALVEMENGAQIRRYLKDLVKISNNKTAPADTLTQAPVSSTEQEQNDTKKTVDSTASQNATKKVAAPQRMPQSNADRVENPTNPTDSKVSFFNSNFRVGEKVLYQVRDKVYTATIISFIGNDIALVEMENGAQIKRYIKDLVKITTEQE